MVIIGKVPSKSNQYRISGNRLYKSEEVSKYEASFALQYKRHPTITSKFSLYAKIFYNDERPDLDGSFKVILDCLQKVGAISNDRLCVHIEAYKYIDKNNPRIEIDIKAV